MPLPTELYEKAAAGFYTLDEVLRMEQVSEIERLDPAQLLGRLSDMAGQEKEASTPNWGEAALGGGVGALANGAIGAGLGAISAEKGDRMGGARRGGLVGAGLGAVSGALGGAGNDEQTDLYALGARTLGTAVLPASLIAGAWPRITQPTGRVFASKRTPPVDEKKEAMNPNFNLKAFKDRMANGGKALKPAMSGFGAGKGPSDMTPGWANAYERVNGVRASGGNVLKELATKKAAASMHSPGGAALIGAAGGAVLGGAVGAAKKPKDGSSRVSRGLRGAGAGALVGGVSGLVAGKNREGREAASLAGEMLGRKTAAEPWDAGRIKDVATHALVHGGVGLGLGLGGVLAHRGVSALANKVTAPLDRNRILSVHPSIERENTPEQISLAYNSLRQFAPHITKDPLAGGNALSQILRTRDALDPSAPPRISGANVMAELGAKSLPPRSEFEPSIMTGMMSGAQGAMGAEDKRQSDMRSQQSEIGTKQPHAREMEYLKDDLARGRDTSSQQNAAHARTLRQYLADRYQHSPEEIENILGGSWNP